MTFNLKYTDHFLNNLVVICGVVGMFFLMACNKSNKATTDKTIIAKAYDNELYLEDIKKNIPAGTSKKDSIAILQSYIQNWLQKQVILKLAEDNLDEELKNVDEQLEEYRNSLMAYAYEREYIREKLDTTISSEEIEKYYNEHPENFQLKDNIVKCIFLRVPKNAPKIDRLRVLYKSEKDNDKQQLQNICYQYATDYYFNENEWLLFDDLLKKAPISAYDKEQYLKNNRFIEVTDSTSIYFINIKGFKIKESLSPLNFETDNIRNLIINKRKLDLIAKMEKDAYNNAIKEKDVEILLPKK
ncbi:MAG: hypothetical protein ACK5B3_10615 [Bacteroidota bacterium]|jgi:hypothetical protein